MTMSPHEIEALAEALVRRLQPEVYRDMRGSVMDAIHDGVAKAVPAAMASETAVKIMNATLAQARRVAFLTGYDVGVDHAGRVHPYSNQRDVALEAFLKAQSGYQGG